MRADLITQVVPHAHQDFLRTMEKIPDPPPAVFELAMNMIGPLYELFLLKQEAAAKGDMSAFSRVVDQEIALIEKAEL